ncbi:MAG: M28 family peptidase [Nitrososphaerota archaeon]|nr:M28 family peptidase [Candidatus Bathyarchaeota archaeon]MDW8049335.1 M28 family peptidase [Nitrososphaerota archaeon]
MTTPTFDYVTPALKALNITELRGHVATFSNFGTRFTGYLGNYKAAEYIYNEFKRYGLRDVSYHYYNITVPIDEGACLILPNGDNVTLFPFMPNMVSPVQTPPGGISGRLIYVGEGEVKDFNGKKVEGSIVLMKMNSQYNWLIAAKYGAKAVIFIEPEDSSIQEFSMKVLDTMAYYFPRLYVKADDAKKLIGQEGSIVTLFSNMKFRQVQARNVIGYLPGSTDNYILITASYDSFSYVPSLAPGAREAIGISVVLQLAKYFASHRGSNMYTLVFIAFSGTNQGVSGSRWFVKDYIIDRWENWGSRVHLQMNFDINDVNRFIMPNVRGAALWGWGEGPGSFFDAASAFHKWFFTVILPDLATRLNMPELSYDPNSETSDKARITRDALGSKFGITWSDLIGGPYRYSDSDPLVNLGGPAFTWASYLAFEKYTYTPLDTPDKLDWEIIEYKLRAIYPYVYVIVNTDLGVSGSAQDLIRKWQPGFAAGDNPKWTDVEGDINIYNVTKAWYDPVPNALFIYRIWPPDSGALSQWQNFPWVYVTADEKGHVYIPGLMHGQRLTGKIGGLPYQVRAFVLNETTGQITHAPGFGPYWGPSSAVGGGTGAGRTQTTYVPSGLGVNPQSFGSYTLFECGNIVLFDFWDIYYRNGPQDQAAQILVNEFATHSAVETWSWEGYMHGGQGLSVAVLHVPANTPLEILTRTTYTLLYPFMALTNSSADNPLGAGYVVGIGEQITITHTTLKAAIDWRGQNQMREGRLLRSGIAPPISSAGSEELFNRALRALQTYNYTELESLQYKLLITERERYLELRKMTEDSVNAITFFGVVLVPFALIFERLIAQTRGIKRILTSIIGYVVPLIILSGTHPGFVLASNILMVIVGFVVLLMTAPLIGIIYTSFIDAVKRMREKVMGVHWIEMTRTSVALLSFSLGVSNMRKRRLRTSLILVSILLITLGVVLFTSTGALRAIVPGVQAWPATYTGIFVHQWNYGNAAFGEYEGTGYFQTGPQLGKVLLTELEGRFSDVAILAPRAWAYMGTIGRGWYLTTLDGSRWSSTPILAVLGVTPQEVNVTITSPNAGLVEGKWFEKDMDPYVAIIGTQLRKELGVRVGDKIKLSGFTFTVIGVLDETIYNKIVDLDNRAYTPMDTRLPGYGSRLYFGTNPEKPATDVFEPEIILIPYKTVLSAFKGMIVSVAIKMKPEYENNKTLILGMAEEFYKETIHSGYSIPLYIGFNGTVYSLFPQNIMTLAGWETQSIPLVIASMVILNLMLGTIEERKRDIFTLSSVGLSPFHIGFLFFAEAITYAILGGAGGYLAGMIFASRGVGIQLNPGSTMVVNAVTLMMGVTIAVTIYPIFVASKLVTPSLERKWKIPSPRGDIWDVTLPFTTTRDGEANGMLAFLNELAEVHMAPDSEVFRTISPIHYIEEDSPKLLTRTLHFEATLVPYELGIIQDTRISDVKEKDVGRHMIRIDMRRTAGPKGSWVTFGREFIDLLRKQILLWRSFSDEERRKYEERISELEKKKLEVKGGGVSS